MSVLKSILSFISAPFDGGASIISTGLGMVNDSFKAKREQKKSKIAHERQIETNRQKFVEKRALEGDFHAASLDRMSIADRGWKDDWLLILTTAPMAIMFFEPLIVLLSPHVDYVVGDAVKAVQKGFSALREAPEYYWYALVLIYIDTFGFRRMLRTAMEQAIPRLMNRYLGKA